jgi:hypothetical protein
MKKIALLLVLLFVASCSNSDTETQIFSEETEVISDSEVASEEVSGETALITQEFITENFDGSLVGEVSIVDCTLSGGTQTECYKFTVAPDATRDHEIGPWCPTNISDTAESGGIWPSDGTIYEVSGDFIENLAVMYSDDSWQLYDIETGEISVTDTQVSCE